MSRLCSAKKDGVTSLDKVLDKRSEVMGEQGVVALPGIEPGFED
jgi:hypothetical protein